MEIKVSKNELAGALTALGKLVSRTSPVEAFRSVEISGEPNRIMLRTANADETITFYMNAEIAEPFSVTVSGLEKPLIGEFDLVVTDGGDEAIVDWKTASAKWPMGKADHELQATAYCYACKQIHKVNPIFRYDVITKAKQPTVSSWYTTRSEHELSRFESLCRQVERSVKSGAFYPNENVQNCGECPYKNRCKQWKGGA